VVEAEEDEEDGVENVAEFEERADGSSWPTFSIWSMFNSS
jgi:hypothetical protein